MTRRLRRLKESYSDINSYNVWEAYNIALERLGGEGLALNLGNAMGRQQLAKYLSCIFEAHGIPFHDDVDESCCGRGCRTRTSTKEHYDFRNRMTHGRVRTYNKYRR